MEVMVIMKSEREGQSCDRNGVYEELLFYFSCERCFSIPRRSGGAPGVKCKRAKLSTASIDMGTPLVLSCSMDKVNPM